MQHVSKGPARLGSAELSEVTANLSAAFLEKHRNRNFFLYIHTIECHDPYAPPEDFAKTFVSGTEEPSNIDVYDAEIRWADENLEQLASKLEELGLEKNTVLIVTSDHGEAFEEHEGMTKHGGKPYNELLHVPLIMRCPGFLPVGRVFNENLQMIDLTPTILDLMGAPLEEQFQGESLLPLILDGDSENFTDRTVYCYGRAIRAAIDGHWKLIYETGTRSIKLYDLRTDFGETRNLALENRSVAESIMAKMSEYLTEQQKLGAQIVKERDSATVRIDQDKIEQLEALGYLH
jgi:arylsulfatase A-like enzyme